MLELAAEHVAQALERLDAIEQELTQMAHWADGDSARREWAGISLSDAAEAVSVAGWRLSHATEPQRPDPARLAALKHRRMRSYASLDEP